MMQQNQLERRLKVALQRECPPPHDLGEYDMGLLPPSAMQMIGEHVQGCPHCQSELRVLRQFLEAAEPSPLVSLIEKVVEWGKDLLGGAGQGALAGVRGGEGRVRSFQVGDYWISITLRDRPDGLRDLLTLVTREDDGSVEGGTVQLLIGNEPFRTARVQVGGNAVLSGIPNRSCDLIIEVGGERLRINGVS